MRVRDLAVFLVKTTTVLLSVAVFFIVFRVRKDTPLIAVAEKEQALFWLMPCLTFFVLLWFCMAREKRVRWTVADLLACVLLAYVVFRSGSRTEYAWAVPVALGCLYLNLRIVFSLSRGVVPVLVLALLSTGIGRGCYRIDAVVRNGFVESFAVRHDRIVFQSGPLLQLPRRDRSRGVLLRADSACRSGRSVGVERAREIRTVVESGYADLLRILAFLAAGSGCLAGDPGAVRGWRCWGAVCCGMPRDARAGIYPKVLPTQEVSV